MSTESLREQIARWLFQDYSEKAGGEELIMHKRFFVPYCADCAKEKEKNG